MRYDQLPDEHRVLRYVPWSKLRKDENDNVLGVLGEAFQLRAEKDSYLSVTWCEYYHGASDECLRCAAEAIRKSRNVGPKGQFAVAQVGLLKGFMQRAEIPIRVLHQPEPDNPAHAAILRWPREEFELLEQLVEEHWLLRLNKSEVDNLPPSDCLERR